jgi:hypothetical protein
VPLFPTASPQEPHLLEPLHLQRPVQVCQLNRDVSHTLLPASCPLRVTLLWTLPSPSHSLMELRYVSDTEVWAVGSELNSIFASKCPGEGGFGVFAAWLVWRVCATTDADSPPSSLLPSATPQTSFPRPSTPPPLAPGAQFLHSLDGGQTWAQDSTKPLQGFTPLGLSVLPDGTAFAALDNTITQESAIAVYAGVLHAVEPVAVPDNCCWLFMVTAFLLHHLPLVLCLQVRLKRLA